jgi:hypothetical protein
VEGVPRYFYSPYFKVNISPFVDDILIFCNGLQGDANKVNTIMDLFGRATGMQINERKSTLSLHNMEETKLLCY